MNFLFEDSFNVFAHFVMGDLQAHLPTAHSMFSSIWPKHSMTPILPNRLILLQATFFVVVSLDEKKVLTGKRFADVEEVKQELFWAAEKMSPWV